MNRADAQLKAGVNLFHSTTYRSSVRSPRPLLASSDRFDQFDQSLKQGLPMVLGFDEMAGLRFQALAQPRVADDFEGRVGESAGRVGDHQVVAVNEAQSGDGFRRGDDGLAGGHGFEDLVPRAAR